MSENSDTETDIGAETAEVSEHPEPCPGCVKRACKSYLETTLYRELQINNGLMNKIDNSIEKYKFSINALKSTIINIKKKNIIDEDVYYILNIKVNKYTKKLNLFNNNKEKLKAKRQIIIKIINKYGEASSESDDEDEEYSICSDVDNDSESESDSENNNCTAPVAELDSDDENNNCIAPVTETERALLGR